MQYEMMGGLVDGIHYTTFIEDANSQDLNKKEGTTKSHREAANVEEIEKDEET